MLWNGSAYMAREEGANIQIVWPEKGAIFWMDSLAIEIPIIKRHKHVLTYAVA